MADAGHDAYAKSWVSQFNDEWFIGLSCLERGFWMQLYTWAKKNGDTGTVNFRNFTVIGQIFGTEKRTASKVVTHLREISRIRVQEEAHCITIEIVNYAKHQHDRQSGKCGQLGKNTPSRQDKTRQDIKGLSTPFRDLWITRYLEVTGFPFEGTQPDFIAIAWLSKKTTLDEFKTLTDWILTTPDKWFSEHRTPRELRRSLNEIRLKVNGPKSTAVKVATNKYDGVTIK